MPEIRTRGRPLKDHSIRAVGDGTAVTFSLLALLPLGLGVAAFLIALDVLHVAWKPSPPPTVAVVAYGVIAIACGLFCGGDTIGDLLVKRRLRRLRSASLDPPPWLGDHAWNADGTDDGALRKFMFCLFWVYAYNMIIITALIVRLFWGFGEYLFRYIVLGLFLLLCVGGAVVHFLRFLKRGRSWLRFARFPFFLGERLEVTLVASRGLKPCRELALTLRCIEDRFVSEAECEGIRSYEVYADTQKIEATGDIVAGNPEMAIAFDLPADAWPTSLSAEHPTYWEIEVRSETPGIDYEATFLVPVYARPS